MHHKTIKELATALQKKEFSSVELAKHYLQRIKQQNEKLNAFITVTEEHALQAATLADQRIAAGNATPLTGIPIAHKDIFCTKDIRTTAGSKMLENFIAPYDATVVKKLNDAGVVMIGKTNCDEFAMGSSNENSYYGNVKNPHDLTTVPGGSSGGSAAAVAADLVPAATGTDTGGSVRQPAALCGITGLKPTYGRVSRFGMIAFSSSLDHAGLFAKNAADIALLLNAIAGHDIADSTSIDLATPDFTAKLNHPIKGLRVGIPKEYFSEHLDPKIATMIHAAAQQLVKLGATLHDITLPRLNYAIPAYYVIAPAECSSNLARYDGIRYGFRCKDPANLLDLYERTRAEGFGDEVKRRIIIGTYVLSSGFIDAYYRQAQQVRRLISNDYQQALTQVDVILGPTTPTTAFKIGSKVSDPIQMYLSDIYTVTANLTGLPALSLPIGTLHGLPVGMQLMGNYFQEGLLLNVAHQFQENYEL